MLYNLGLRNYYGEKGGMETEKSIPFLGIKFLEFSSEKRIFVAYPGFQRIPDYRSECRIGLQHPPRLQWLSLVYGVRESEQLKSNPGE